MTVSPTGSAAQTAATAPSASQQTSGFSTLGSADFLKLMTAQMKMQDPFNPVDNKEMLAQMAQFSSLSATTDNGATLDRIAAKLDVLIAQNQTPDQSTGQTAQSAA
ncbi:flagellar hook capping FlgD N-terminal domain-containing protein [Novosphingobium sp. ZN18A2]|uniref:flagellar hook assembly protein FlgD n=1 Tax=Novosphingobium sp. ZN18A2 TaxID=3079861 RepID=UPI0030D2C079